MHWIDQFDFLLFDFDGLLVNTEQLHFAAYRRMLKDRGYSLDWTFAEYACAAHFDATRLRDAVFEIFPALQREEPNWDVLYAEKKVRYSDLLRQGAVALMPGVEDLLQALSRSHVERCVVTHSPDDVVMLIRQQIKLLSVFEHWITRADYTRPKPDPECYQLAIRRYGAGKTRIIGFEDSVRGLTALQKTEAIPILICADDYPDLELAKGYGVRHFESFSAIPETGPV